MSVHRLELHDQCMPARLSLGSKCFPNMDSTMNIATDVGGLGTGMDPVGGSPKGRYFR